MQIAHQEDIHRREEITMGLLAKMNEMVQEDQGSKLRIEELECQRDLLRIAVEHVNRVHQNSLEDHVHGIERIEEASHAQHLRDEELATSLHQELGQLRNDAAQTFTSIEHQVQGEGQQLAMEYQRLVTELNQEAHETLQSKSEASQNLSAVTIMKEQMGLMKNGENALWDEANKKMSDLESGAQELRNRLDREEFAKSETMMRLRQMETTTVNEGGVSPSALHSEVGKLRRRLKQQEEFQARSQQAWRQEIKIARRQPHLASQQYPSMPLSSKTSDAGWEYVHSQGSQKGLSFPLGNEVRSPELSSPTLRSPTSRSKVASDVQPDAPPIVQDVNMDPPSGPSLPSSADSAQDSSQFRTYFASGGYGVGKVNAQHSERANAFRGAQLQDLLKTQGMWRPSMPSSSMSRSYKNIFKENDDNGTGKLIARLIEEDVRNADAEQGHDHNLLRRDPATQSSSSQTKGEERWLKMESEQQARMDESSSELRLAKETEDRLGGDREYWKHTAEYYQQAQHPGGGYGEGEEEEVTPSESPTNLGPSGPGGGKGGDPHGSPSHSSGRRGGDPPGPPSEDPSDGGVHDGTEVKISRREADNVIVPPFPKVTHLDSWMSHCIANMLTKCADPNHDEWISWTNPAFRPDPDIEGLNDSGRLKFKRIDVKLGVAMTAMLKAAGDAAMDLYLVVNCKANKYVRENSKLNKGRQIIAMMYESFRTRDRLDMVVTLEYLIKLQYQGDQHMSVFKQTWLECIDRMRPEDVPSENALRDTLHSKIKESPALKMELLVYYDMLTYDDPKRSYKTLLHLIDRCIQKQREQKMLKQTQVGLQQMIQGKDPLSAMAAKAKGTEAATPAPKKPTKQPKHEEAAPVLPQSKAKAHAKAKAGKGKGKGKDRDRSESVDAKAKMKHMRYDAGSSFLKGVNAGLGISAHTAIQRRLLNEAEVHLQILDVRLQEVHPLGKERRYVFSTRTMGTSTSTLQRQPKESQRPRLRQRQRLKRKLSQSQKGKRKPFLRLQPFDYAEHGIP